MHLVDQPNSTFTNQELERLTAYRAAVAAGFYTDWDGSAHTTDSEVLAWLLRADGAGVDGEAYPFTLQERQRLEECKAAIAAGRYTDDGPPPPPAAASATTDEATH